jgi:ATP-dependent RNA helicase DeaD
MNKFEQLDWVNRYQHFDLGFENPSTGESDSPIIGKTRHCVVGSDRDRENGSIWFPVIQKIDANNRNTQALILSPTRENLPTN